MVATIISNPGASLLIHFFWIEDSLAHNLDITRFRIDLPKQAAPIAFVTGRTPDLVNLNQDRGGITVKIDRLYFLNMPACSFSRRSGCNRGVFLASSFPHRRVSGIASSAIG